MLALASACLVPACGDENTTPDYFIGASAAWSWSAPAPDALGYTVALLLEQRVPGRPADPCRAAPASTRLTVNDSEVPLTRDPESGCLVGQFLSAPTLGPLVVTARVEEEGQLVGEVVFDHLMPGTAATLVSPADGQVAPGGEIVIVPPPVLPADAVGRVVFYPLDEGSWQPTGILSLEHRARLLDGIHVRAPAFTGPAVLIIKGSPAYVTPAVTCPGLAGCTEIIEATLGPLMLTGVP